MDLKKIAVSYIIILFTIIIIFLNVSEDKYCITYEGSTINVGDAELYISGLDGKVSQECFNNTYERNMRFKKIKEYTNFYLTKLPESINQSQILNRLN